jgi:uncharacterized protein YbjT (DUF2867 family)
MDEPILVTGGTGVLGREVVDRLVAAGRQVRVVSRNPPAVPMAGAEWIKTDLLTGEGLPAAVRGIGVIVHCATSQNRVKDVIAATNLIEVAHREGAPHLIYISIVGVDRVPYPYYKGKFETEKLIEQSGLPFTILRATQFHDLLRTLFAWTAKFPVMFTPALSFQPVDVAEVADRLAELAVGSPAGRVDDMGGPQVRRAADLARAYLSATQRRRFVLGVRLPGKAFAAFRQGGHLAPDHAVGRRTFEQYLAGRAEPRSTSYRLSD